MGMVGAPRRPFSQGTTPSPGEDRTDERGSGADEERDHLSTLEARYQRLLAQGQSVPVPVEKNKKAGRR